MTPQRSPPSVRVRVLALGLPPLQSFALLIAIVGCTPASDPAIPALAELPDSTVAAPPRLNGNVGAPEATPPPQIAYGTAPASAGAAPVGGTGATDTGGDITLDFADTDIREVVAQVLGSILKVNYTIDPAVHGTATLRTV